MATIARADTEAEPLAQVMLPDDHLRKMKQDLSEAEAKAEVKTRHEPDPGSCPPPSDPFAAFD